MNDYSLKVFMAARDRTHLTEKAVRSIHQGCKVFKDINIYMFDNLSEITTERMSMVQRLLTESKICYYSYDTDESLTSSFGKVICFQRWIKMMELQEFIRDPKSMSSIKRNRRIQIENVPANNYYMLVDNDMIFNTGWDELFITAANNAKSCTHFIVPWPGGMPGAEKRKTEKSLLINQFNKTQQFEAVHDHMGGASGMWFMKPNMLPRVAWKPEDILAVYKQFKRHDSITWRLINRRNGNNRVDYVMRVIPPNMDIPPVIHLGGIFGSLCNQLTRKNYNAGMTNEFKQNDENVKDLSIEDLLSKYGKQGRIW
jgi:hypothetical protein